MDGATSPVPGSSAVVLPKVVALTVWFGVRFREVHLQPCNLDLVLCVGIC